LLIEIRNMTDAASLPEHNQTGQDYSLRSDFAYTGPIIDFHSHVTMTAPTDQPNGPAGGAGAAGSTEQAELMLEEAAAFGITRTITMCPLADIVPLHERFGRTLGFNAMINKKPEDTEKEVLLELEKFLAAGIEMVKLWSAPRGRERGYYVNAPWRIAALKEAYKAGIRLVMVHVGDPDHWWTTAYTDTAKFGTKADQYTPLCEMMELFPEMTWIGAHMGGDPEHPEHLQELMEKYPHYHCDTSATKWQVREVSRHPAAIRTLIEKFPDRFLFGSDLVTRHGLPREHYVSRYWCQRMLWESSCTTFSPISDGDYVSTEGGSKTSPLCGVGLKGEVLEKVYFGNANRLLASINSRVVGSK
jgi:predicted TIM-barrel fold metal-dependent hydrolase